MFTKIGGSGYEPDIEDLRDIATRSYDRGHDPQGSQRQLAAIIADRDRTPLLRRLTIPATVIHGAEDKLVRPSGGRTTAKAIPGAKLLMIDGMGHGLPRGAWPQIIGAIADTAARGEAAARGAHTSTRMSTMTIRIRTAAPRDRAALPLSRPEAGVRAVARVAALGRLADPVVVVVS